MTTQDNQKKSDKHGAIRPSLRYPDANSVKNDDHKRGLARLPIKAYIFAFFAMIGIAIGVAFGLNALRVEEEPKIVYTGEIILDDSLSDNEKLSLQAIITDEKYSSNITISAQLADSVNYSEIANSGQLHGLHLTTKLLTDIFIPITGLRSPYYAIDTEEATEFYTATTNFSYLPESRDRNFYFISVKYLTDEVKVLDIEDQNYLETGNTGGFFRIITLTGGNSDERNRIADRVLVALEAIEIQQQGTITIQAEETIESVPDTGGISNINE